jgi:hypothetical protein
MFNQANVIISSALYSLKQMFCNKKNGTIKRGSPIKVHAYRKNISPLKKQIPFSIYIYPARFRFYLLYRALLLLWVRGQLIRASHSPSRRPIRINAL